MHPSPLARFRAALSRNFVPIAALVAAGVTALAALPAFAADGASEWTVNNIGGSINTEYHDGWATITHDGLTLYFASNRPGGLGATNRDDGWYMGKDGKPTPYSIYVSHRATRTAKWSEPKLLPKGVNSGYADHSALQSDDGHWLFFASDRPGGCGGLDLYVSYRKNTQDDLAWEAPRNLGCAKDGGPNGAGIDSCPNFDNEGHLYFTSAKDDNPGNLDFKVSDFDVKTGKAGVARTLPNSTPGMDGHIETVHGYIWAGWPGGKGGSDIWQFANAATERDAGKWTNPRLLPAPINTEHEDQMPAATRDGKVLTFVSDRPGGKGGLDIYEAIRVPAK